MAHRHCVALNQVGRCVISAHRGIRLVNSRISKDDIKIPHLPWLFLLLQVNPMLSLLRQIEGSLHDISIHQSSSKPENGKSKSPSRTNGKTPQTESEFDQMVENHAEEWNGLQELHLLVLNWRYLLENSRESSSSSYNGSSERSKSGLPHTFRFSPFPPPLTTSILLRFAWTSRRLL